MYKFIKQYAETMDYAAVYPIISLLIFFVFFVVLLWYVTRLDRKHVHVLSNIPLNDNAGNPGN